MPIDFPSPAVVGRQYTYAGITYAYTAQGIWSEASQAIATLAASKVFVPGGQLTYVSATQLAFLPFNGNQIKINGRIYTIPNAGIAGLQTISAFLEGVPNQNLAASTPYYVYAFVSGGTLTADFRNAGSTVGHRPSQQVGNEGVEVRYVNGIEDNTRSLIGAVMLDSSAHFVDTLAWRGVASWFNRRLRTLVGPNFNGFAISSGWPTAVGGVYNHYFWSWGDAALAFVNGCEIVNSSPGQANYLNVGIDGVAPSNTNGATCNTANVGYNLGAIVVAQPVEGWHFFQPFCGVGAGSGTYYGYINGTVII
jgi:hypothetical protein